MLTKVGTFSKATGAATANQSITGVGFRPKLVMLFATRLVATGWNNTNATHHMVFGASDGTNEWCRAVTVVDNSATPRTTTTQSHVKALALYSDGLTPSLLAEADLSLTNDGFDLAWTTNNAEAWQIGYLCIGGASVSAAVGFLDTTGVTGDVSVTGLAFRPKIAILGQSTFGNIATATLNGVGANFAIGAYDGTNQGVISGGATNAGTTNARRGQNTTAVLQGHNTGDPRTIALLAAGTSLNAAGFTINVSVASSARVGYIAIGGDGAQVKVVADATKLTTGTQATTGIGFQPKALLMWAWGRTASASLDFDPAWSFGLTDGSNHHVTALSDISTNPTKTSNNHMTTKALGISHNGSDVSPTVEAEYESFDGDGYTLDYTVVTGAAEQFITVAFGGAEGGKSSGGKGKGGQTPNPGPPPKKPLRTSLSKSWKWDRGWR
jgi:hypothetical protein